MRADQRKLDRHARDLGWSQLVGRRALPARETGSGSREIGFAQCMENFGEVVAELAESHREIENSDVPYPAEHRADRVQRVVHGDRDERERAYSKEPRDDAV